MVGWWVFITAPHAFDDLSCGRLLLSTKETGRAPFGSSFSQGLVVATCAQPSSWNYGGAQLLIDFSSVSRANCSAMLPSNTHVPACTLTTHGLEESSIALYDSGLNKYGVMVGSEDIQTLYVSVLSASYNMERCQGHLLILIWQLLRWNW